MLDDNPQPIPASTIQPAGRKPYRLIGLGVLLVIVIAFLAFGAWRLWSNHHQASSAYHYSKLDNYTLPSQYKNAAITFAKPVEFSQASKSVNQGSSAAQLVAKPAGSTSAIGYISVASQQTALATNSAYLANIHSLIKAHNSQDYDSFVQTFITAYLSKNLPAGYNSIRLGQQTGFLTNANITKNAYEFSFSATGGTAKPNLPVLKGYLRFLVGKRTFYYISIATVSDDWSANQSVWDQMSDDIKIDQ